MEGVGRRTRASVADSPPEHPRAPVSPPRGGRGGARQARGMRAERDASPDRAAGGPDPTAPGGECADARARP